MIDSNGGTITDTQWKVLNEVHERLSKLDFEGFSLRDPLFKEWKDLADDIVRIAVRIEEIKKNKEK